MLVVAALGGNALLQRDQPLDASVQRANAEAAAAALEVARADHLVVTHGGTDTSRRIERATPIELRRLSLAAGSMGPKVEAACRFVEAGGLRAAIGSLRDASRLVRGEAGTVVTAGNEQEEEP